MSLLYRTILRPAVFLQDSEKAHNRLISTLSVTSRSRLLMSLTGNLYGSPDLPVNLFGLQFPNPLGIAAGLDKNGAAIPAWQALGFGFSEIGGVTLHDQLGNPKPRMFRATAEKALVNRRPRLWTRGRRIRNVRVDQRPGLWTFPHGIRFRLRLRGNGLHLSLIHI